MPLTGDGNKFTNNQIGIHNEAGADLKLNNSTFDRNVIGYLEGRYDFMDSFFQKGAPEAQKKELTDEIIAVIKAGEPEKAESIFKKYDFHKWIASGANITKILEFLTPIAIQLPS